MPTNDVLIKVAFQMSNARSVDAAINKLRNLGAAQNVAISRTTVFGSKGKKSLYDVSAASAMTSTQWGGIAGQVETVMSKVGRLKNASSASMKVMQSDTGRVGKGMGGLRGATDKQITSYSRLKKISWGITMTTLSMLGVYFSVFGLVNMLTRGFGMLLNPLMDVEKAAETVAMAFAFGSLTGMDLKSVFGDMGSIMDKLVPAWIAITALSSTLSTALIVLGASVFSDEKFVSALKSSVIEFAKVLTSPEVIEAIKTLILEFAKMLPTIANMIPTIAGVVQTLAPFIPLLVVLASVALVLMPLLSVLSSIIMMLANASAAWTTVTGAITGALTILAAHPIVAALLIIATVIAAIINYFGLWDETIKAVTESLHVLLGPLGYLPGLMNAFSGVIGGTVAPAGATTTSTVPSTTKIEVQQYNTNYIAKEVDADNITAALAKDFAYKVNR